MTWVCSKSEVIAWKYATNFGNLSKLQSLHIGSCIIRCAQLAIHRSSCPSLFPPVLSLRQTLPCLGALCHVLGFQDTTKRGLKPQLAIENRGACRWKFFNFFDAMAAGQHLLGCMDLIWLHHENAFLIFTWNPGKRKINIKKHWPFVIAQAASQIAIPDTPWAQQRATVSVAARSSSDLSAKLSDRLSPAESSCDTQGWANGKRWGQVGLPNTKKIQYSKSSLSIYVMRIWIIQYFVHKNNVA